MWLHNHTLQTRSPYSSTRNMLRLATFTNHSPQVYTDFWYQAQSFVRMCFQHSPLKGCTNFFIGSPRGHSCSVLGVASPGPIDWVCLKLEYVLYPPKNKIMVDHRFFRSKQQGKGWTCWIYVGYMLDTCGICSI